MSRLDPRSFGRRVEPEPVTPQQAVARVVALACFLWFAIFLGAGLAVDSPAWSGGFVVAAFLALFIAMVAANEA